MQHGCIPDGRQSCLWMTAGVLNYRLCDRDFDCDHCSLDAALRTRRPAGPRHEALLAPTRETWGFPDDRRYTRGHCWLQACGCPNDGSVRLGVDAFAATLIGRCQSATWHASPSALACGDPLCHVDLGIGILPISMPIRGQVTRGNDALADSPCRVVTEPYDDGWIVEFRAEDSRDLDGLLSADAACENARLDLQRFRRQVAVHLFDDATGIGRSLPDGGELIADLRQLLGGTNYLDLLREMIY
jgi:glycine cleavage system H protein